MASQDIFSPSRAAKLVISRATPPDVESLTPIYDAYRVFSEYKSNLEGTRQYLLQQIQQGPSIIWLARMNDTLCGFLQATPEHCGITLKVKWHLSNLYVIPEARGQHIGSQLIHTAKRHAAGTGSDWLFAFIAHDNVASKALFAKFRFARDTDYEFIFGPVR